MRSTFFSFAIAAIASVAQAADTGLISFLTRHDSTSPTPITTLVSLVSGQPAILDALTNTLGPITVFAPTDSAFKTFLASPPAGFSASNSTQVADVLLFHVAPVVFTPSKPREFLKTLRPNPATGGSPSVLRADFNSGAKSVNLFFGLANATVVASKTVDLADGHGKTGQAIVHFIDTVLVPPTDAATTASSVPALSSLVAALTKANLVSAVTSAQNITVLAPVNAAFDAINTTLATLSLAQLSNVLTFHVIPGIFYSTDLIAAGKSLSNIPTLFTGGNLTETNDGTNIKISGPGNTTPASVVIPDVLIANGVVHVIDAVLLPNLGGSSSSSSSSAAPSVTVTGTATGIIKSNGHTVKAGAAGVLGAAAAAGLLLAL